MYKEIKKLYSYVLEQKKLNKDYCVVFVFDEVDLIGDPTHFSECIYPVEQAMIVNAFRKSVEYVYPINSEDAFIKSIPIFMEKHKYILVYSMAQNVRGSGRRCLIPLLCEYYGFINIGNSFAASIISTNKHITWQLLQNSTKVNFPRTYYFSGKEDIEKFSLSDEVQKFLLKPIDESASIGINLFDGTKLSDWELTEILYNHLTQYNFFFLQEFIPGDEVEVPLLFFQSNYYSPGIVKILFAGGKDYLDYDIVASDNYGFEMYKSCLSEEIATVSTHISSKLGFKAISRIDFKIHNNVPYVIDIGANPTISFFSSTNYAFRALFEDDESSVYRLLIYSGLISKNLIKPPFDNSK